MKSGCLKDVGNGGRAKLRFPAMLLMPIFCLLPFEPACGHPDPLENIKIYTYILSISPENPHIYLNRGICYRLVSDLGKAIEDFDQAEKLGLKGRPLWMNRAMTRLVQKRYEDALLDMTRILDNNPRDSTSYYYRGEIYFKQGRYEEAIADYSKSIEIQPTLYLFFVRADAHRCLGNLEAALGDYSAAIRMDESMVPFRLARAKLLGQMKRYEDAQKDLDAAVGYEPERHQIYIERAVLAASRTLETQKSSELATALKYLEDELFFRPKDPSVFADRARIHELQGNLALAESDLNTAVENADVNDPAFIKMRADFFRRQRRDKEASLDRTFAFEVESRPIPTATPLPGPTLTYEELRLQPTPNLLPELQR